LLALAAAGCASTPRVLPTGQLLANAPHFPDDELLCGPAVLASLLVAAGRPANLAQLEAQVYLPGREGSLQAEMLAAPRRHGLLSMTVPGGLDGVAQELAAGNPVALLLNLSLPFWPRWHYVVLTGLDGARQEARLHSGMQANARWTLATLESTWARSGHWAFVATAPGRLPATATAAAARQALLALDRSATPADTAPAWAAAAKRWPDDLTLAIGEANAWVAGGDWAAAEAALLRTTGRFESAAAWNNLAQVRLRTGNREGALAAALRAQELATGTDTRWLDAVKRTLAEIGAKAGR
jgi:hypothetical protein